jgi:predicted amidohydrolase
MRITICQLNDDPSDLERDWEALVEHTAATHADIVLLPEMPFASWFAVSRDFEAGTWRAAVEAHERWIERLPELGAAGVLGTRPVDRGGLRHNEAFVWDRGSGARGVHLKAFLPREVGFFETDWYHPGPPSFEVTRSAGLVVGFQICTEMWSLAHAQHYGKLGAQLIAVPRATSRDSGEKWLAGGRVAAIVSGAFSASSCRTSRAGGPDLGGGGWVAGPDGQVLGVTSDAAPMVTVEVDPAEADRARGTYPRYAIPDVAEPPLPLPAAGAHP